MPVIVFDDSEVESRGDLCGRFQVAVTIAEGAEEAERSGDA